ncbi:hypothetical protein H4219_003079 [Mycoemilia scoparia]|uniref:Uncharacterized protein n=1 Tax=Mycoemilia scoparia TaxID=417184 RepID=A0A9W8A3V0_9FUNG|nr:hypothetical protein H4219_003079 [Mycoemilia scoparia]
MGPTRNHNKAVSMTTRIEGARTKAPALRLATMWINLPAFSGRGLVVDQYISSLRLNVGSPYRRNIFCAIMRPDRVGLHPRTPEDLISLQNNPLRHGGTDYRWVPDFETELHIHIASVDPKITAPEIEQSLLQFGTVKDLRQYFHVQDMWHGDWEATITLNKGSTLPVTICPVPAADKLSNIDTVHEYEVSLFAAVRFCLPCGTADTRVCMCFAPKSQPRSTHAKPARSPITIAKNPKFTNK